MSTATTEENKELIHEYLDAWENQNPDAIPALLADDFSVPHTDPTGAEVQLDAEGIQEEMAVYDAAFSELGHEVHEIVAEDDWVVVRITIAGVHDGEFLAIEPTGNRIEIEEYLSFRVADGEIVDMNSLADGLALLRQLDIDLPIG